MTEKKQTKKPKAKPAKELPEDESLGAVSINNDVFTTIARKAALGIKGIVDMDDRVFDGFAGLLGKKAVDRGISIDVGGDALVIDLHIVLAYGVRIPQVAGQLQVEVGKAIEQMTGKSVKSVNVVVQSVKIAEEDSPTEQEGN